ncbi:MAG: hypothetical protein IPL79_04190 [Myxococcales bacterium]|nr:hypothetical protein [Myxococcales bacterium]
MVRRGLAFFASVGLWLGAAVADAQSPLPAIAPQGDVVELVPQHAPFSRLQIDNSHGNISIEGYDGSAIVVRSVRRDDDQNASAKVEVMTGADGTASVRTALTDHGGEASTRSLRRPRIDLFISVPRQVAVKAHIQSGVLRATDLRRGAALYANAGAIEVSRIVGALLVDSTFAAPTIREVAGDVDVEVLAANVLLSDIAGDRLQAGVHRGDITATRITSRHIVLRVFRGDVALQAHGFANGDVRISTTEGDIAVRLTPLAGVQLRARGNSVVLPGGGVLARDSWHFGGAGNATAVTLVAGAAGRVTFALP